MKKLNTLLFFSILLFLTSSCDNKQELYEITDKFVEELSTSIESYGVLNAKKETVKTKDNRFQVMPTGRILIIKILDYAEDGEYEDLKEDLASHYSGDDRVRDVYINRGGTVVVDCRN